MEQLWHRCRDLHRELPDRARSLNGFQQNTRSHWCPTASCISRGVGLGQEGSRTQEPERGSSQRGGRGPLRGGERTGRAFGAQPDYDSSIGLLLGEAHPMRLRALFGHKMVIVRLSSRKIWVWLGGSEQDKRNSLPRSRCVVAGIPVAV
jgi:hypothetical protein